jgi:hypothetical protein
MLSRIIAGLSVPAIDTALMPRVLEPIWTIKPETQAASAARSSGFSMDKGLGYRIGENPAR